MYTSVVEHHGWWNPKVVHPSKTPPPNENGNTQLPWLITGSKSASTAWIPTASEKFWFNEWDWRYLFVLIPTAWKSPQKYSLLESFRSNLLFQNEIWEIILLWVDSISRGVNFRGLIFRENYINYINFLHFYMPEAINLFIKLYADDTFLCR